MITSRSLRNASRLRGRGADTNERVKREFALDPGINRLFATVLRAEVRLTLAGLRSPAGGSRVVVGRAIR